MTTPSPTVIEEARKMAEHAIDIAWNGNVMEMKPLVQAFIAAIELGERRADAAAVGWLREQSDIGADHGIAAPKGSTRRAAYGGGSLVMSRAADTLERGDHRSKPA